MTNKIYTQYYKSPVGEIMVGAYEHNICLCDWRYRKMRQTIDNRMTRILQAEYIFESNLIVDEAIAQLDEYFTQSRRIFDLPLLFVGTDFQKTVWDALYKIPYGSVLTYTELAQSITNKNAVRAVASANGANAISIIVPCHRIIGSNGDLVGYAGGLPVKEKLLKLESDLLSA